MPTASELRHLCSMSVFLDSVVASAQSAARSGETYYTVVVPEILSIVDVGDSLRHEFPECKITRRWFTRIYDISWI